MQEMIFAGFGGQGVLAAGVILANAALQENLNTTWLPSYGGAMRGGTANCSVKIAEEEIASPYIDSPDILVVFNELSLNKFEDAVKPGGYIFVNSSLIKREVKRKDVTVIKADVSEMAAQAGNVRAANVYMVGVILANIPIVSLEGAKASLEEYFKAKGEKVISFNKRVLEEAYNNAAK